MTPSSQKTLSYIYAVIAVLVVVSITKKITAPSNYDIIITNGEVLTAQDLSLFLMMLVLLEIKFIKLATSNLLKLQDILMLKA